MQTSKQKEPIKILGAGVSGLSAAIALSKAGYGVEVFERNKDCGQRFGGDLQGLENWSEQTDVIEDLKSTGIEINFDCTPFSSVKISDEKVMVNVNSGRPFFYLVKRGQTKGSLDNGLKLQALAAGIKIKFSSSIPQIEANIIATGPIMNEICAIDKGIIFETEAENIAVGLLDQKAACKGYSYLLITEGYGCMCTVLFDKFERVNACFDETKKVFSKLFGFNIKNPKNVGGIGCFSLQNQFQRNGQLYVGEAAGIQDLFLGFGIRSAIKSGHLAARSIIENLDYAKLAKNCFTSKLKASLVNRFLYEALANKLMVKFALQKMRSIKKPHQRAFRLYNITPLKKAIYPFARLYMKSRYKNLRL